MDIIKYGPSIKGSSVHMDLRRAASYSSDTYRFLNIDTNHMLLLRDVIV